MVGAGMRPFTLPDEVFYASAACLAAFIALFLLRCLARLLVPPDARRGNPPAGNFRIRRAILATALAVSLCSLLFGWRQRIGQRWMAEVLEHADGPRVAEPWYGVSLFMSPPVKLSTEEIRAVLSISVLKLPAPDSAWQLSEFLSRLTERACFRHLCKPFGMRTTPIC